MSQYSTLKWGVAGAGKISNDFVAAVLADNAQGHHEFIAVASKTLASAQSFAQTFKIAKAYGSYEELANDVEIHAVYIGNLNVEHFSTAKLFLEHGKHVLLEKPLTTNAKETDELTQFARSKNLFLMEALWSRFLPSYQFVQEQIRQGTIGEVLYASVQFGVPIAEVPRVQQKKQGGGTILDLGVYTINAIMLAFNNEAPESIVASGNLNEEGIDTNVSAIFNYSKGRTGVISTHAKVQLPNEAHIVGTKGVIKLAPWFHCTNVVEVNGVKHDFSIPPGPYRYNFVNSENLKFEANHVRESLLEGRIQSEVMSHRDSVAIAKIQDELRRQLGVSFD